MTFKLPKTMKRNLLKDAFRQLSLSVTKCFSTSPNQAHSYHYRNRIQYFPAAVCNAQHIKHFSRFAKSWHYLTHWRNSIVQMMRCHRCRPLCGCRWDTYQQSGCWRCGNSFGLWANYTEIHSGGAIQNILGIGTVVFLIQLFFPLMYHWTTHHCC